MASTSTTRPHGAPRPADNRRETLYEVEYAYQWPGEPNPHVLTVRRFTGRVRAEDRARRWVATGYLPGSTVEPEARAGLPGRTADVYRRQRVTTIRPEDANR
jgi:hypothetical protein